MCARTTCLACLLAAAGAWAQKPAPPLLRGPAVAPPPASQTRLEAAPQAVVPAWPLRFELLAGEGVSTAFPVTQAGSVNVQVQSSGALLVVLLRRPDGRSVERQGSGSVAIEDMASDADLARGIYWSISIRTAQAVAPTVPQGVVRSRAAPQVVATGTITVRQPPVDAARAQAALGQASAKAPQAAAPVPSAPPSAPQVQAEHDKAVARQHATQLQALRASMPPEAQTQMQRRIDARLQGQSLQQVNAAQPLRPTLSSPSLANTSLATTSGLARPPAAAGPAAGAATGTTKSAASGAAGVAGSGAAATATAPTTPVIASLSASEGDPGKPLVLAGRDFGAAPGELRFIVGAGRDIAAPVTYWSASQIVAEVPYADGIPIYDGHAYVRRADGATSALVPFRFVPMYDVASVGMPLQMDGVRGWVSFDSTPNAMPANSYAVGKPNLSTVSVFGDAGYDEFWVHARLRNGWVVDGAEISHAAATGLFGQGAGNAYVVDLRAGTDSPWVKVRWWVDPASQLAYSVRVNVKRPRNLPCANPCAVL
jgi:hypothetical protein